MLWAYQSLVWKINKNYFKILFSFVAYNHWIEIRKCNFIVFNLKSVLENYKNNLIWLVRSSQTFVSVAPILFKLDLYETFFTYLLQHRKAAGGNIDWIMRNRCVFSLPFGKYETISRITAVREVLQLMRQFGYKNNYA